MTHLSDKATDKEVLQAALEKAIENGWDAYGWPNWQIWGEDTVMFYDKTQEIDDTKWVRHGNEIELSTILFDHEFCKALWGDDLIHGFEGNMLGQTQQFHRPAWQYHGTQMFLAEDRIDYLRRHL